MSDLAKQIHNALKLDLEHPQYYESIMHSYTVLEIIILLVQFLNIHTDLRATLTFENIDQILLDIVRETHPEMTNAKPMVVLASYLLRQDFLTENLFQQRHGKKCCLP